MQLPNQPELYQEVVLIDDVIEHNLYRGDVATLVDFVPHPQGGEKGGILELFNASGESVGTATVPLSKLEPLRPNDRLSVRRLARSSA